MENNLKDGLLTVCNLLTKYEIDYMLIGGTAVALNGFPRLSLNTAGEITDKPDIDVWFNPTYDNYFNILKVLDELGHDTTEFKEEKQGREVYADLFFVVILKYEGLHRKKDR